MFFVGPGTSSSPSGVFYRVQISARKVEEVAPLGVVQSVAGVAGFAWWGMTPDGAPLSSGESGQVEIYALDVKLP